MIDDFGRVFPRLWTVWILTVGIAATLAEIVFADALNGRVTPLQLQCIDLALLVAALVARGLVQQTLRKDRETEREHHE